MAPFAQTRLPAHLKPGRGRPSDYRPEYCDLVIEHMAKGYSLTAFAFSIRINLDTVYQWITSHREFAEAVNLARCGRVALWETKLLNTNSAAVVSATVFALKNAAPNEWRDVRYQEHNVTVKADSLTDAQLLAIAARAAVDVDEAIDADFTRMDTR